MRTRLPIAQYGRYISRALHHSSLSLYETPSGLLYLPLLRLPPPLSLLLDSIVILILYYLGSHHVSRGPANATPESRRRMGKFRRSAPVWSPPPPPPRAKDTRIYALNDSDAIGIIRSPSSPRKSVSNDLYRSVQKVRAHFVSIDDVGATKRMSRRSRSISFQAPENDTFLDSCPAFSSS